METEVHRLRDQVAELTEKLTTLEAAYATLQKAYEACEEQKQTLHRQLAYLRHQLFGRKSEKLDRNQLEFALGVEEKASVVETRPPMGMHAQTRKPPRRGARERKVRIPEGTPVEELILDPEEVKENPQAYECIGQEVLEELDVVPNPYFVRRIIRRKFKVKGDRKQAPIIVCAPERLIEGSYASAGLLSEIILKKYVEHVPLYRQEQTLRMRYGIHLSSKTMCDWVQVVAGWLKPIYNYIADGLRRITYLQIDETPIRYLPEKRKRGEKKGKGSALGYVWVYHDPEGDVLYEWHTSRAATCLEGMLDGFRGTVQCDGYKAYTSYAKRNTAINWIGCWAHARRYFHDACEQAPTQAGWLLLQIGHLYQIEAELRDKRAGPRLREAVRNAQSMPILKRIEKVLRRKQSKLLPSTKLEEGIAYSLARWDQLLGYCKDGRLEIDNNLVENRMRPLAIGKKNFLFFGAPQAGQQSAIIYTILESCKRRGINPQIYLRDVLTRLPHMKIGEVWRLIPAVWKYWTQQPVL